MLYVCKNEAFLKVFLMVAGPAIFWRGFCLKAFRVLVGESGGAWTHSAWKRTQTPEVLRFLKDFSSDFDRAAAVKKTERSSSAKPKKDEKTPRTRRSQSFSRSGYWRWAWPCSWRSVPKVEDLNEAKKRPAENGWTGGRAIWSLRRATKLRASFHFCELRSLF